MVAVSTVPAVPVMVVPANDDECSCPTPGFGRSCSFPFECGGGVALVSSIVLEAPVFEHLVREKSSRFRHHPRTLHIPLPRFRSILLNLVLFLLQQSTRPSPRANPHTLARTHT
jgi:hypothetical protein